jgi:hypothetical protein
LGGADTSCNPSGHLLNPGTDCVLGIEFAPQSAGTITGSILLTDNTLNVSGATQQIQLSGADYGGPTATLHLSAEEIFSIGSSSRLAKNSDCRELPGIGSGTPTQRCRAQRELLSEPFKRRSDTLHPTLRAKCTCMRFPRMRARPRSPSKG